MKAAIAIQNVMPVTKHAEVADLREDPVAFLEWILAAAQAGDKRPTIKHDAMRWIDLGQIENGRVEIGKVNQVSRGTAPTSKKWGANNKRNMGSTIGPFAFALCIRFIVEDSCGR